MFHLMVLLASAFIAPSFVPLMAALVSRRLNWQGVVVGYFLGLAVGLSLLGMRAWYFPLGHWHWLMENFDGASVLINTAVTIGGMWLGTALFGSAGSEQAKYDQIFAQAKPVQTGAQGLAVKSEQVRVIALATAAVGVLLGIAGVLAASRGARLIDLVTGFGLVVLAYFRMRSLKRMAPAMQSS